MLVGLEPGRALAARHLDRFDLRGEFAGSLGGAKPLLRAQSPLVLRLAAHLVFANEILRVPAGRLVGEGVIEPVAQHAVVKLPIAHAVAPAAARDEIGGQIHVLHTARDRYVEGAQCDLLRRRHDRLGARPADAVDRHRRNPYRQPGVNRGLAGGIHLAARLHDVAHDHGGDVVGFYSGALDRGFDHGGPKVDRGNILEATAERADRGANRPGENDGS